MRVIYMFGKFKRRESRAPRTTIPCPRNKTFTTPAKLITPRTKHNTFIMIIAYVFRCLARPRFVNFTTDDVLPHGSSCDGSAAAFAIRDAYVVARENASKRFYRFEPYAA